MIPVLSAVAPLKLASIAAVSGLVLGLGLGGWAAHAYYAPRLALAELRAEDLGRSLRLQNTAVDKLSKDGAERARLAKIAIAEAQKDADQAQRDAMDILTRQPPAGVDRCTAASSLIAQELAK